MCKLFQLSGARSIGSEGPQASGWWACGGKGGDAHCWAAATKMIPPILQSPSKGWAGCMCQPLALQKCSETSRGPLSITSNFLMKTRMFKGKVLWRLQNAFGRLEDTTWGSRSPKVIIAAVSLCVGGGSMWPQALAAHRLGSWLFPPHSYHPKASLFSVDKAETGEGETVFSRFHNLHLCSIKLYPNLILASSLGMAQG